MSFCNLRKNAWNAFGADACLFAVFVKTRGRRRNWMHVLLHFSQKLVVAEGIGPMSFCDYCKNSWPPKEFSQNLSFPRSKSTAPPLIPLEKHRRTTHPARKAPPRRCPRADPRTKLPPSAAHHCTTMGVTSTNLAETEGFELRLKNPNLHNILKIGTFRLWMK